MEQSSKTGPRMTQPLVQGQLADLFWSERENQHLLPVISKLEILEEAVQAREQIHCVSVVLLEPRSVTLSQDLLGQIPAHGGLLVQVQAQSSCPSHSSVFLPLKVFCSLGSGPETLQNSFHLLPLVTPG